MLKSPILKDNINVVKVLLNKKKKKKKTSYISQNKVFKIKYFSYFCNDPHPIYKYYLSSKSFKTRLTIQLNKVHIYIYIYNVRNFLTY